MNHIINRIQLSYMSVYCLNNTFHVFLWVRGRLCKLQKMCTRLVTASDKVYQLFAHGRWFSSGTPASPNTKAGRHDIAEILLKVALKYPPKKTPKNTFFVTFIYSPRPTAVLYILQSCFVILGNKEILVYFLFIRLNSSDIKYTRTMQMKQIVIFRTIIDQYRTWTTESYRQTTRKDLFTVPEPFHI